MSETEPLKQMLFRGSNVHMTLWENKGTFNVILSNNHINYEYAWYTTDDYDTAMEIWTGIRNHVSKHECSECGAETFRVEMIDFYHDVEIEVHRECGEIVRN